MKTHISFLCSLSLLFYVLGKSAASNIPRQDDDKFEFGDCSYGKNNIKLLYVQRDNEFFHHVREYEIDVHLRLASQRDYLYGDNRDVIATDSMKNTIYILAKNHGVTSPEKFGMLVCLHFLDTYKHVKEVHVNVEEYPWERHDVGKLNHSHAFVFQPTATKYCQVIQRRNESPKIIGGLKNLRVLKTTQSSFKGFIRDEYRTLPDATDRVFSTIVSASWEFSTASVEFDLVWNIVKDCIFDNFAGHPETGIYSPSVQNTLYLAEKCVLRTASQVSSIEMQMPNKHYFAVDFTKFNGLLKTKKGKEDENREVYLPIDKPSGIIYAQLHRKDLKS